MTLPVTESVNVVKAGFDLASGGRWWHVETLPGHHQFALLFALGARAEDVTVWALAPTGEELEWNPLEVADLGMRH